MKTPPVVPLGGVILQKNLMDKNFLLAALKPLIRLYFSKPYNCTPTQKILYAFFAYRIFFFPFSLLPPFPPGCILKGGPAPPRRFFACGDFFVRSGAGAARFSVKTHEIPDRTKEKRDIFAGFLLKSVRPCEGFSSLFLCPWRTKGGFGPTRPPFFPVRRIWAARGPARFPL